MSSAEVIDALFERTVDIVQSLPKSGPIQTSYEEKLALYSLYKQATEGNVKSKRPGMLDMLGRAKWDAWANRRGLSSQDAKQLYVESMLKTLRKFGDRPEAMALIEELESFSGDVAQRVMSASLARADSASEGSSDAHSPQLVPSGHAYEAEEDEKDAVAQLPRATTAQTLRSLYPSSTALHSGQRTPMSVEGASAMAVRGDPSGTVDGDSEYGEKVARPSSSLAGTAGRSRPIASQRNTMPVSRAGNWARPSHGGPSEARMYAPPNAARYPGPSASEAGAMMGGGASMYSGAGPSARPTPSEQHYYHHHGTDGRPYATSSIGGRSNPAQAPRSGYGPAGRGGDVDLALQSIQASLAALHERMNRVEDRSGGGGRRGDRRGPLAAGYRAVANALHDIAIVLGLRSDGRGGVAPSTYRGDGAESSTSRAARARKQQSAWGALIRLSLALMNLTLRLTLDATSVLVVLTVLLFLLNRLTGRGDPLLLLRFVRQLLGTNRLTGKTMAAIQQSTAHG